MKRAIPWLAVLGCLLAGCDVQPAVDIDRDPRPTPIVIEPAPQQSPTDPPRAPTGTANRDSKQTVRGRVVYVADGDTLTILETGTQQQRKVRLHGIDAPERSQDFGDRGRQALSGKVANRDVAVEIIELDPYGRTVGEVYVGDRWINEEIVREGFAWHYKHFSRDPKLATAEREARQKKAGLWSGPTPMAPWEYRRTEAFRKQRDGDR